MTEPRRPRSDAATPGEAERFEREVARLVALASERRAKMVADERSGVEAGRR